MGGIEGAGAEGALGETGGIVVIGCGVGGVCKDVLGIGVETGVCIGGVDIGVGAGVCTGGVGGTTLLVDDWEEETPGLGWDIAAFES